MPLRLERFATRTIVRDVPRGMWAFGSVFVLSGLFVLVAAPMSRDWARFSPLERVGVIVIGLGHFIAGCYSVWRYEATVTTLDHASGEGTHEARRPFHRAGTLTRFRLGDIRTVEISKHVDGDGDPMYQLRLWLAESRVLALQSQPAHGIERAERSAAALRDALGLTA